MSDDAFAPSVSLEILFFLYSFHSHSRRVAGQDHTGYGQDQDPARLAVLLEDLANLAGGGARGEDVVHQDEILSFESARLAETEGVAYVPTSGPNWGRVGRDLRRPGNTGRSSLRPRVRVKRSVWSNPRFLRRRGWEGTGTRQEGEKGSGRAS